MLHITVIAVGRLKERFWVDACDEYLKRLKSYAVVKVHELSDADPTKLGSNSKAVDYESRMILETIPADAIPILLDIKGKDVTSEGIAEEFERLGLEGSNNICFIIGGSCGVNDEVRQRVKTRWSFGRITLPHNLARVVLLEQIYRAFRIIRHEPYHK